MNPRTAEMYVDSMDNVANGLIANIRNFSKSNSKQEMPEDFQNELYKWTLESIGVIAYNRRIGLCICTKKIVFFIIICNLLGCLDANLSKDSDGQKVINAALEMFDLLYELDVLPSLWPMVSTRKWRRYVKVLDFFTE